MVSLHYTAISLRSGKLNLEGIVSAPLDMGSSAPAVVLCHPHPLLGGDMNNPVMAAVSGALVAEEFITLSFNFRGVGSSEGVHDEGRGEVKDLEAALGFLAHWPGVDRRRVGVAGYSFGAMVTLSGLNSLKGARAFAFISPPTQALKGLFKPRGNSAMLFVAGEHDALARERLFEERIKSLDGNVRLHIVPGANHFWRNQEAEVSQLVSRFFVESLG